MFIFKSLSINIPRDVVDLCLFDDIHRLNTVQCEIKACRPPAKF